MSASIEDRDESYAEIIKAADAQTYRVNAGKASLRASARGDLGAA